MLGCPNDQRKLLGLAVILHSTVSTQWTGVYFRDASDESCEEIEKSFHLELQETLDYLPSKQNRLEQGMMMKVFKPSTWEDEVSPKQTRVHCAIVRHSLKGKTSTKSNRA